MMELCVNNILERDIPVPAIDMNGDVNDLQQFSFRDRAPKKRAPPRLKSIDRFQTFIQHDLTFSSKPHFISFRELDDNSDIELPNISNFSRSCDQSFFERCFECITKIGEGSFGEVYKVRSKEDDLFYAVKRTKKFFRGEGYRRWRLEEVRRCEQFSDNENCVRFYRAWEEDNRLYMQMELCRENLEQYINERRRLPERDVWHILLDLLLALKCLHDHNLIHLDIKLDNILVSEDNTFKLADFGLVIDVDKANMSSTEGDARYLAPEIMKGEFSKSADIFSLGITILELSCCLELPVHGPLWQQLRNGNLPDEFLKRISIELQTVIKQMMHPEPKARPTVQELLKHTKISGILQRRNRWIVLKKIKRSIYKSYRGIWCNLRKILNIIHGLNRFIKSWRPQIFENTPSKNTRFVLPTIRTNIVCSTPTNKSISRPDFLVDENSFEISDLHTPSKCINVYCNSTPLSSFNYTIRSRKDLLKTDFLNCGVKDENNETKDLQLNDSEGSKLNELDVPDSLFRIPTESFLRKRKALFVNDINMY